MNNKHQLSHLDLNIYTRVNSSNKNKRPNSKEKREEEKEKTKKIANRDDDEPYEEFIEPDPNWVKEKDSNRKKTD